MSLVRMACTTYHTYLVEQDKQENSKAVSQQQNEGADAAFLHKRAGLSPVWSPEVPPEAPSNISVPHLLPSHLSCRKQQDLKLHHSLNTLISTRKEK